LQPTLPDHRLDRLLAGTVEAADLEGTRLLLKLGADPEARRSVHPEFAEPEFHFGNKRKPQPTVLQISTRHRTLDIARLPIERGADVNSPGIYDRTLLDRALWTAPSPHEHLRILELRALWAKTTQELMRR
jgi:hypothetical protein